jgi:ArsR family transcriptional regulator
MANANHHRQLSGEALELIARRFKALSDPTRLKLIISLEEGEKTVSELVRAAQTTQANVSRHLLGLTDAGLLSRRKEGVSVRYAVADPVIFDLCDLVCGSLRRRLKRQARASQLFRT